MQEYAELVGFNLEEALVGHQQRAEIIRQTMIPSATSRKIFFAMCGPPSMGNALSGPRH